MKKALSIILTICTLVALISCTQTEKEPIIFGAEDTKASTTSAPEQPSDTSAKAPADTAAGTQAGAATQPPVTTDTTVTTEAPPVTDAPVTDEPPAFEPYKVRVKRADFPVYSGPSYEHKKAGTVKAAGTYTIVEEAVDSRKNVWGKLKSGVGWIDLTLLYSEEQQETLVSAGYADDALLSGNNYYYYTSDPGYDGVKIAFYAHAELSDVSFYSVDVSEGYERGEALFRIPLWTPSRPFVANVAFGGTMSTFGLKVTDKNGREFEFQIIMSGMDGSIVLLPVPAEEPAAPPSDPGSASLPQLDMYFSSGAGAWGTSLSIKEDGSFSGEYHDSDMGDRGPGYPNGTMYICSFTGKFNVTKVTQNAIYLQLTLLDEGATPSGTWIENGIRYIASSAYGLEDGTNFILYTPDHPAKGLPEDLLLWIFWGEKPPENGTLGCYALYCTETGNTFFT